MSYAVPSAYSVQSYTGGPVSFAAIYLLGGSTNYAPGSSNLAKAPLGQYGKWAFSFAGSGSLTTSAQFPVRIGPRYGFVSLASQFRPGLLPAPLPAYGNVLA
jgi:hypothetical protein